MQETKTPHQYVINWMINKHFLDVKGISMRPSCGHLTETTKSHLHVSIWNIITMGFLPLAFFCNDLCGHVTIIVNKKNN